MTQAPQPSRVSRQEIVSPAAIFSGQGILLPVFGLAGFIAGPFISQIVLGILGMEGDSVSSRWMLAFVVGGGALSLWFYVRLFGKEQTYVQYDRHTRQHNRIRNRHLFFFLPPVFWATAMTAIAGLATFRCYNMPIDPSSMPSGQASAKGRASFDAANELLFGMSKGRAHGNTPEAKEMAEAYSDVLREIRNEAIEKQERSSPFSTTRGNFITYCLLTEQKCVFMVHVPGLRNFAQEAKDLIADAAWALGARMASSAGHAPHRLVIGVRGELIYDRVMVGDARPSRPGQFVLARTVRGQSDCPAELAFQFDQAFTPAAKTTGEPPTPPSSGGMPPQESDGNEPDAAASMPASSGKS